MELGSAKKGGESAEVRKLTLRVQRLQDQLAAAGLDADDVGGGGAAEKAKSPSKK